MLRFSKTPTPQLIDYLRAVLRKGSVTASLKSDYASPEWLALQADPLRFALGLPYGRRAELVSYFPPCQFGWRCWWAVLPYGLQYNAHEMWRNELIQLAQVQSILWRTERIALSGRLLFSASISSVERVDVNFCSAVLTYRKNRQRVWYFTRREYGETSFIPH